MTLTYVELFAGAGGLSHGLDAAGWQCLGHAEIEPHARAVLRYRWPDVPLHGDVSALDGTQWRGVTLLSGGSPCQDLSVAGKRAGLSGRRSGLFFHQVRLWIESQAPLLLWENVVGALSSKEGKDFARVLSTIAGEPIAVPRDGQRRRVKWSTAGTLQAASGIRLAWRVLDLRGFGVPQRRRRVFVLAARAGGVDPAQVLLELASHGGDRATGGDTGQADPGAAGVGTGSGDSGQVDAVAMDGEYNVRVGVMGALNIGSSSGSGRRPAVLQPTDAPCYPIDMRNATRTTDKSAQNRQGLGLGEDGDPSPTLTSVHVPAVVAFAPQPTDAIGFHLTQDPINGKDMPSLGATSGGNAVLQPTDALTFDARGNGTGDTVNTLAGDHQNRVTDYTALVVERGDRAEFFTQQRIGEYAAEKGAASTINARDYKSVSDIVVADGPLPNHPRRLLPIECERLMSWPDHWTATGIDEQGREYQLKDTPRYKLCGNGVASIVAAWIGLRLADAITPHQEQVHG